MRRDWEPEDLIAAWTLVGSDERELLAHRRGATRLGFALLLKFFEIEGRFPDRVEEFPPQAVDYMAAQVGVDPGVMIYWHVETGRACIYSQLTSCSASEVAAMMTGLLHHGTDAPIEANYVDTHGASVVGFAFTHLLGYQLMPRLKNIGAARLYLPDADLGERLPRLESVLTRPIRWELIAEQYDQMIRYATALRLRTAEADQVLRRFTRPGPQHPTHAALAELGRAVKTVFLARYLRSEALRRQVNDGLQVVENWNSANTALFYGKDADLTGPDRDAQETSVLALHLLQSALVHVNTLLVQRVLADRPIELTGADRRAITPLFWGHAARYGNFHPNLDRHLDLTPEAA